VRELEGDDGGNMGVQDGLEGGVVEYVYLMISLPLSRRTLIVP